MLQVTPTRVRRWAADKTRAARMRPVMGGVASAALRNAPVCMACLAVVFIDGLSSKETGLSIGGPAVRARGVFAKGHLRGAFRLSLPRDLFLPVLRTGRLCRQAGAICSAQQLRPVHCLPAVCNILLAAGRQLVQKEAPCPARDRGPPGRQVMRVYYFDCSFSGAEALSAFALSASGAAGASGVAATGSSGCAP